MSFLYSYSLTFVGLLMLFSHGLTSPIKRQEGQLFEGPHVFLTLSAIAGMTGSILHDTEFELNWYGWEWMEGDYVGLFSYDPTPSITNPPLVTAMVNASTASQGYFKTTNRFGRPEIDSEDKGDNCLGFWIAYVRNDEPLNVNCFRKYPRWMNNLRETIGDTPLSYIMIPGTHDAGAIREYDGTPSENILVRYSATQEEQLYRQFVHGIRYVDIRCAHYPGTEEVWYINHGTARFQPLKTLFSAIRRFVEETGEIIFMDFHGFPVGFDGSDSAEVHSLLLDFVLDQVGDLLLREDEVPLNPTPNDVWSTGHNVILTYQEGSVSTAHPFLWPYLIHAWGDKNTIEPLEEYFENDALPTYGCSGVWWSAMAEMTPSTADAILYPLRGLRGFAQMINIPLSYWWMRDHWYSRSMIVSTDFFLGSNIMEMAVEANAKKAVCPGHY